MFNRRPRRGRPNFFEVQDAYNKTNTSRPPTKGVSTRVAFCVLLAARIISALYNIVHDCDEVYNYWEPLHYLVYGFGMQTWEYSSQYALRGYFYLLLHCPVAVLTALLVGAESGKVLAFYATKAFLGLISASAETALYRATRDNAGAATGHFLLALLAVCCGLFTASTSLLPSSFAMYALTWAAAGVLRSRPSQVVAAAVVCVIWGWPVAGVALLPYGLYLLFSRRIWKSLSTGVASLIATLVPVVLADRLFYGTWTVSLWNFVKYNVVGGGDSALYGVEPPSFYLKNGLLNLNLALPLGLVAPFFLLFKCSRPSGGGVQWRLLVAVSPVWAWLAAISALPHKEERFLYVVYPLVCLGAALVLNALGLVIRRSSVGLLSRRLSRLLARLVPLALLAAFVLLSLSRSVGLAANYGAPMKLYTHLPEIPAEQQKPGVETFVCVGEEWHRFPSAFFLPSPAYRLAFLKSGFSGLLPRAFNLAEGGTAAASPYLNDRNKEEPANYWREASGCSYLVHLRRPGSPGPPGKWKEVVSLPFMLASQSKSTLARVLYIPWLSWRRNYHADYVLYSRS